MAKNTFQFLEVGRVDPQKLDAAERIKRSGEIYGDFDKKGAAEQSERCLECVILIVSGNVQYITTFQTG